MGRGCCLNVPCDTAVSSVKAAMCALHDAKLGWISTGMHHSSDVTCSNIHHAQPSRPVVPLDGSPKCAMSITIVTSLITALYKSCAYAENDTMSHGRDGGRCTHC